MYTGTYLPILPCFYLGPPPQDTASERYQTSFVRILYVPQKFV